MRCQQTVLGIALCASLTVTRPATAAPSASTTLPAEKQKIHWFTPVRPTEVNNDLKPVEGISRRAWTTTAGWHPGVSDFPDTEMYSSRMNLFWVGHQPWQHATHSIGEQ